MAKFGKNFETIFLKKYIFVHWIRKLNVLESWGSEEMTPFGNLFVETKIGHQLILEVIRCDKISWCGDFRTFLSPDLCMRSKGLTYDDCGTKKFLLQESLDYWEKQKITSLRRKSDSQEVLKPGVMHSHIFPRIIHTLLVKINLDFVSEPASKCFSFYKQT